MTLDARQVIKSEADTRRPLIHHLTADNSWLLQIPRPEPGPRLYFNVLMDVWLVGSNLEYTSYFHEQKHTIVPAARDIGEVERFASEIETLARELRHDADMAKGDGPIPESFIDAVAISQEGTDHCNEATLTPLPPSVPIFAYGDAAVKRVRAWNHFETIVNMPSFTGDWHSTSVSPLPEWVGIGGIIQQKDTAGLHAGIVVSFMSPYQGSAGVESRAELKDEGRDNDTEAEAVIYMPHGIPSQDPIMATIAAAAPQLKVLAILHGLLRVLVGARLGGYDAGIDANLGAHNGLALKQTLNARYWIPTHDEPKEKYGFTQYILTDFWLTLEEAVAAYAEKVARDKADILREANYHHLGNGAGLVLV